MAENGFLDLRNWDFESDGTVDFSGQWYFYWRQLLSPSQITSEQQGSIFAAVPGAWQLQSGDSDVRGYATFRLKIALPQKNQVYGLSIKGSTNAYRLWIDGREMASNGVVGRDEASSTTEEIPISVFFSNRGEAVDVVVQVSGFDHRNTGFRNKFVFGLATDIHEKQSADFLLQAVCVSVLFTLSLYHFFIFAFRKKNMYSFYFAIFCLLMSARFGITNNNIISFFVPGLEWTVALKIEYIGMFFLIPVILAMMKSLYPKDLYWRIIQIMTAISVAFSIFTLFSDNYSASQSIPYHRAIMVIESMYGFYFLIRIFKYKREGRHYIGMAILVGILGIVGDFFYSNELISTKQFGNFGILAYTFIQAISLASRSSNTFRLVEKLSEELSVSNFSLQESEHQYRAVFEDSLDTIFVTKVGGTFEKISPASLELIGYTAREIIDMRDITPIISKRDMREIAARVREEGSLTDYEVSLQHRDGREVRVLVNTTFRRNSAGEFIGFQGFVHDITDRITAEEQRQRADRFEYMASVDSLTGAHTRRYFYESSNREMTRATRNSSVLSLIILDIDFFKLINDKYGHLAGDKVLVALAKLCRDNLRATDIFCRFGGEEFIILLPETDINLALQKAEQLRELLSATPLTQCEQRDITVSFSAGIAGWESGTSIDLLIASADKALYKAKETGRNRCVVSPDLHS